MKKYNISPALKGLIPYINSQSYSIDLIKSKNISWHTCTPKSGSSSWDLFISKVLQSKKIKVKKFGPVPMYENRDQFPCPYHISKQLRFSNKNLYFSTHQHTSATEDFLRILSKNHIITCQTRSILDTIISLVNYIDKEIFKMYFSPAAHLYWHKFSSQEKIEHIVLTYLPRHIQYLQTWINASEYWDVKFIYYDDVVNNPAKIFNKVYSKWNLSISNEEFIENNSTLPRVKIDKGVSGAGRKLIPNNMIERIGSIIEDMDKLDQSIIKFM
jgi:hypothetical protein